MCRVILFLSSQHVVSLWDTSIDPTIIGEGGGRWRGRTKYISIYIGSAML